jgi:hypothetical protein
MRVPRIPGLAGGPKIILLPPPPGRTVKAHATTTALWMRSYGSVPVRVPAFGWTSGQPFPTEVTALRR